jgi:hypothetical protein
MAAAVMAVLDPARPAILGQDARESRRLRQRLAKAFHYFGRNGLRLRASAGRALWTSPARLPTSRCGACSAAHPAKPDLLRQPAALRRAAQVAAACERAPPGLRRSLHDHLPEIAAPKLLATRQG